MSDATSEPMSKVVFIVGSGRSGTTLLGNLLGEHPSFFHAGEVQRLCGPLLSRGMLCGCRAPVAECGFWGSVLAEAFDPSAVNGLTPKDAGDLREQAVRMRHLPRLLRAHGKEKGSDRLERYREISSRLYATIARRSGARVVVDSSKGVSDALALAMLPHVPSYFVHLVRDPRAVAYSWHRQKTERPRKGNASHWTSGRVTRNWVMMQGTSELLRLQLGRDRWITVRYEDLLRHPSETLSKLLHFIGEPSEPELLIVDGKVHLSPNHTAGGNGSRFRTGSVSLELDNEWVTRQLPRDRRISTAIAFPLLSRFGYSIQGGTGAAREDVSSSGQWT